MAEEDRPHRRYIVLICDKYMVMQARRRVDFTNKTVGTSQWLRDIPAEQVEAGEPHTQILHELRAESCGGGMDFTPHYVIFGGALISAFR